MKPCRYLGHHDGRYTCAYWDMPLRGDEDIRCHLGGWECYEEPGGCIFEGRWMTLAEYADYLESKSEREIPEGYECQEFRLDRRGLADLLRPPLEGVTGEFHYLKLGPEYPDKVKMVALARLQFGVETLSSWFARAQGPPWIASLSIVDGPCQVDVSIVRKGEGLGFIEGTCSHGDFCPKVEELKCEILQSAPFVKLREDIARELFQRALVDRCNSYDSSPGEVPIP